MKKLFLMLIAAAFLLISPLYSQVTSEIDWLNQIDKKQNVTYGDAVNLFMFQLGKNPSSFEKDTEILLSEGIGLAGYTQDEILTKGMLSKMTAEYLDLGGSLMYLIFGSERYAFKACIAYGFFTPDGSSTDKLSGPGMIEVFSRISEFKGEQK